MSNWARVMDQANRLARNNDDRYRVYGVPVLVSSPSGERHGWRYYIGLSRRMICPDCEGTKWFPCTNTFCGDHLCETCRGTGLVDRDKERTWPWPS